MRNAALAVMEDRELVCDRIGHAGQISCLSFPPSYFPLSRSLLVKYTELSRNLCPCPSFFRFSIRFSVICVPPSLPTVIFHALSRHLPRQQSRAFSLGVRQTGRWLIDGGRRNHVCGGGFSRSGLACRYICRLQVPSLFFFAILSPRVLSCLAFFFFFYLDFAWF